MPHILVIDDDDQVRGLLKRVLERTGYSVDDAENGKVGLARHRDQPADLIITDIVMPEQEGLETIQELRRNSPETKVLAISGGGFNQPGNYLTLASHFGAHRVLPKPIEREVLLATVFELVGAPQPVD